MDDSETILRRLDRIESLDREGADPAALLDELRALLTEAEAWAAAEGDGIAGEAVVALRSSLERDIIAV